MTPKEQLRACKRWSRKLEWSTASAIDVTAAVARGSIWVTFWADSVVAVFTWPDGKVRVEAQAKTAGRALAKLYDALHRCREVACGMR